MPVPEVLGTLPTERATATTVPHVIGEPVVEVQGLRKVAPLGSPAQGKAKQVFPKAKVRALAAQQADFALVATERANAIVVEDPPLAPYGNANPGRLVRSRIKPLAAQYGAYAVQYCNTALANYLKNFLCTKDKNGALAKPYKKSLGIKTFVRVPAC